MKASLYVVGVMLISGTILSVVRSSPIVPSSNKITFSDSHSNSTQNCTDTEIELHCDQCQYFLYNCSEEDHSRKCQLGENSCGQCGPECLNRVTSNHETLQVHRERRQAGPCINIKGACGDGGRCCANLFCQSTSAGRGNRHKTCRP